MDFFAKFSIALAVICAAVLLVWLFFIIKRMITSNMLLNLPDRSEKTVLKLLTVNYKSDKLLKNVVFPFNLSPDSKLFRTDAILVNRGGILIVTIRNMHGTVENPFHGDWRQFYNNSIMQLRNPLELNAAYTKALNAHLRHRDIENVPINSIVVYIDNKTKFKTKISQIVSIDRMLMYIHDMNNNHFLSMAEQRKVSTALRDLARKPKKMQSPAQYRSNDPSKRPQ